MNFLVRSEATQGSLRGKGGDGESGERGDRGIGGRLYVGAPAPLSSPFASAAVATPGGSRPTDSAVPYFGSVDKVRGKASVIIWNLAKGVNNDVPYNAQNEGSCSRPPLKQDTREHG